MSSPLSLADNDLARLQEILQVEDVPSDPETEEFTTAVNAVMEVDPELAQRYILAVPMPSAKPAANPDLETENQAKRALNRQRLNALRRRLFMAEMGGDWVPNQMKIWAVTLGVLVIGIGIAGYFVYADSQQKAAARAAAARVEVVEEEPVIELPEPEPAPTPSVSIGDLTPLPPAPVAAPPPAPAPAPAPAPVAAAPTPVPAPPLPAPPAAPVAPGELDYNAYDPNEAPIPMTVSSAPAPTYDALSAPPVRVFTQTAAPAATAPGATMNRPLTAFREPAGATDAASSTVFADNASAGGGLLAGGSSVSVFAQQPEASSPILLASSSPVGVTGPDGVTAPAAATVYSNASPEADASSMTVASSARSSDAFGGGNSGMTTLFSRSEDNPPAADAEALAAADAPVRESAEEPVASSVLVNGSRLAAELVTSATVLDGTPGPVLAQTMCGPREHDCDPVVFTGMAQLLAGDRLVINFDQAIVSGEVVPVTAMALGTDLSTSIPAQVMDQAPTFAQDMFRQALGGVSDYVQALAGRTRSTVVGETIVTESIPPELEDFVMGRVAGSFSIEGNRMSFVRVAELPAGTPVVVLVGSAY